MLLILLAEKIQYDFVNQDYRAQIQYIKPQI